MSHSFATYFNHCPIVFDTKIFIYIDNGIKPLRFEAMWVGDDACSHIVEQTWAECDNRVSVEGVMHLNATCGAKLQ